MRHAVHAEWTKLRTLPATAWLPLVAIAATVLVTVAVTASIDTSHCASPTACHEDTTALSLTGVRLGQAAIVVLAVLTLGDEFGTGTLQGTLAATPRRHVVLGAKAAVVTAAVVVAGALGAVGSLLAGRALLARNGFTPEHGYPDLLTLEGPTLRAAGGTVLYLVCVALLALGVAAAVRDTAWAVTAVLGLLYLAPLVASLVSDPQWQERLRELTPMTAGLAIQATTRLDQLPIAPWAGLAVLACYAAAALLLGGLSFVTRDA